jgi:hypothetical protein
MKDNHFDKSRRSIQELDEHPCILRFYIGHETPLELDGAAVSQDFPFAPAIFVDKSMLSTVTTWDIPPMLKYGIRSPTLRPIRAAPLGDNTDSWRSVER